MTDIVGKTISIIADQSQVSGTYQQQINVSELSQGVYFVVLQTNKGRVVHRIVVSK